VETGAKMFVGLSGEGVDCADAVAASTHRQTRTKGAITVYDAFRGKVVVTNESY